MLDYVYRINLPTDVLLDGVLENVFKPGLYHNTYKSETVLKPEWLTYKGFNWTTCYYFAKRGNQIGGIHSDCTSTDDDFECGINWIFGGDGMMEYWNNDELPEPEKLLEPVLNLPVRKYTSDPPPSNYRYSMPAGVYLINGVVPHRGVGVNGVRHVVSLRTPDVKNMTWEQMVDLFKDVIIDSPRVT